MVSSCGADSSSETNGAGAEDSLTEEVVVSADDQVGTAEPVVPQIYIGNNAELLNELETSRVFVINSIQNLSPQQWKHSEHESRWSIAEITEHLVSAERLFLMLIDSYVIQGTENETRAQSVNQTDKEVIEFISNRANSFAAPFQLQPAGVFDSVEQGVSAFKRERALTLAYLQNTTVNLRGFVQVFPGMDVKPMDAHQWFIYICGHTSRHLEQISQVKAHYKYPF